jgi:hypothetical protein
MNTAMAKARTTLGSDEFWYTVKNAKTCAPVQVVEAIKYNEQFADDFSRAKIEVFKFFRPEICAEAPVEYKTAIDPAVFNSKIGKEIQRLIHEDCDERETETVVAFDVWNFVGGIRVRIHCRSVLVLEAMERSVRAEPKPAFAYAEKLAIRVDLDSIKIDSVGLSFDVFSDPSFRSKEFRQFISGLKAKDSVTLSISELFREDDWTIIVEFKMSPAALAKDIEGKPIL